MFFRLQLVVLHFIENSNRKQPTNQQDEAIFCVSFAKSRKAEGVAKEVKVKPTYGMFSYFFR